MIAALVAISTAAAGEDAGPPFGNATLRYRHIYVEYGDLRGCYWSRLGQVPAPAKHPHRYDFRPGPFNMSARKAQLGVSFGAETSWFLPMMKSWSDRSLERSQGAIDQLNALVLTCEPTALSKEAWQERLASAKRWERQFYLTYWVQFAHLKIDRRNHDLWLPWIAGEDCIHNRNRCDVFLDKAYDHLTPKPEPASTP